MTVNQQAPTSLSDNDIDDWFDSEEENIAPLLATDEELSKKYVETQVRIVRTTLDFTLHTLVS